MKLTLEWFPMLNPYVWPYSFLQILTGWYFDLWLRILPTIRLKKSSINVSIMVSLEVLNVLSYFSISSVNMFTQLLLTLSNSNTNM